ncbi:MAG: sulfite exporter TauE/SafE family protein [Cyclobacteriaceae bacterium]
MELIGFVAAVVIGFTMGLIGGGGSILTVPVMVYFLNIDPVLATAYSLFIVGLTSLIGSFSYMLKQQLDYKTAVVFAIPSFIAVYSTRKFIVPAIPAEMSIGGLVLEKGMMLMLFFGVIMFVSAFSMIRSGKRPEVDESEVKFNYPLILIEGALVGIVTGLVGAGGGFLIIPALVLLARLPMKLAVGTSLIIIAVKSLIGFLGDIGIQTIDWSFVLIFSLFAVFGIFGGSFVSKYVQGEKLKRGFGWFVAVMALFIFYKELWS